MKIGSSENFSLRYIDHQVYFKLCKRPGINLVAMWGRLPENSWRIMTKARALLTRCEGDLLFDSEGHLVAEWSSVVFGHRWPFSTTLQSGCFRRHLENSNLMSLVISDSLYTTLHCFWFDQFTCFQLHLRSYLVMIERDCTPSHLLSHETVCQLKGKRRRRRGLKTFNHLFGCMRGDVWISPPPFRGYCFQLWDGFS